MSLFSTERRIHRFSGSTDTDILTARVSLAEAQLALAKQYGYGSWKELTDEARSHPPRTRFSLTRVWSESEEPIPDYAGAGVPSAVVAALNHAGVPIRFMELAASSGWAFSFGYLYHDISPDYMDGGLITGYRTKEGSREIFFEGTVDSGWKPVGGLDPYAVYSFVREGEPLPREEITRQSLARAVRKAKAHEWENAPQGLAALEAYLPDVGDPAKTFEEVEEWFCWATFQRLMARRCCQVWLASVGEELSGEAGRLIQDASHRYGKAFRHYDRFLGDTRGCDPPPPTLYERARAPDRIARCAPHLEQGIGEERQGIDLLEKAVELMG